MSSSETGVAFRELLAYTDYLAQRWLSYFEQHPAALEVDVGGQTGSVRNLVHHIFQVEQIFAGRLHATDIPAGKTGSPSLEALRGLHQSAHGQLANYAASASAAQWKAKQPVASRPASHRKLMAQAVLHSVHHWAQVAMAVRQAGFPAQKPQDIILSDVME